MARIAELEAKLSANGKATTKGLYIQRSEKGAVSVYGVGRFPVTLYWEQWLKLLAIGKDIEVFIEANKPNLSTKPVKQ